MENEDIVKDIVLARLHALPEDVGVSFGDPNIDILSKDDLIRHVQHGDAIGNDIMDLQMEFLTSLKELRING